MIDIFREMGAVQRQVGERSIPAGAGRTVRLRREYDAPIDEVWDALTNPERIGRWFLPVSGDFRLGGRFQFEGNAGGEIVACDRPHRLQVTWAYGEADASVVEVRLSTIDGTTTRFELEHTAVVPEGNVGGIRTRCCRRGLGAGPAGPLAPSPRRIGGRSGGLAGIGGGPRVRDEEQ